MAIANKYIAQKTKWSKLSTKISMGRTVTPTLAPVHG